MSIPSQQVRTEQPSAAPVECGNRSPLNDRGPYLGMSLLSAPRKTDIDLRISLSRNRWTVGCRSVSLGKTFL